MTRMKRHVKAIPILVDYLRKEMYKSNRPHTDDRLKEPIYHFAMLSQH